MSSSSCGQTRYRKVGMGQGRRGPGGLDLLLWIGRINTATLSQEHLHTFVHTYIHTNIHSLTHKHTLTHTHTHTFTHTRTQIYTHTHTHAHTHSHTHTHTHTHTMCLHVIMSSLLYSCRFRARHIYGELGAEEVQDGPGGGDPSAVPPQLHFCPGHDDQGVLPGEWWRALPTHFDGVSSHLIVPWNSPPLSNVFFSFLLFFSRNLIFSVPFLLHITVWEDSEGLRSKIPADLPMGYDVSRRHTRGRGMRSSEEPRSPGTRHQRWGRRERGSEEHMLRSRWVIDDAKETDQGPGVGSRFQGQGPGSRGGVQGPGVGVGSWGGVQGPRVGSRV